MILLSFRIRCKISPIPTDDRTSPIRPVRAIGQSIIVGSEESIQTAPTDASELELVSLHPDQNRRNSEEYSEQTADTGGVINRVEDSDQGYDLADPGPQPQVIPTPDHQSQAEEVNETLTISATSEENECNRYLAPDNEEGYYLPYREEEADGVQEDIRAEREAEDEFEAVEQESSDEERSYSKQAIALKQAQQRFQLEESYIKKELSRGDLCPLLFAVEKLHSEVREILYEIDPSEIGAYGLRYPSKMLNHTFPSLYFLSTMDDSSNVSDSNILKDL